MCHSNITQFIIRNSLILLGTLFLLAGCGDNKNTATEQPLRPVKTIEVAFQSSNNSIVQTGEIRPRTETTLGFRLDGRVLTRSVDIGSRVKSGDIIATIDPRDSENQLQNAQSELASAISAERLAKSNLTRMKTLAPGRAIAPVELDQAQSNWESAVSRRESAQTAVKSAKERLSFTRLTAAESGVITTVNANPGQVVSTGQEVVKIAALAERDAVFDVPARLLNQQNVDPVVTVSLLSDPSLKTIGHIRDISPQADAVTRTFRVRIALDNPPDAFIFGTTVLGTVQLPDLPNIIIPASALTSVGNKPAVYVVDPSSLVLQLKPITVARYTETDIFVSEGLVSGDHVVVAGVNKLRPGTKVVMDEESHS
ncbi:MAG: efflux RND transporter periplasmic adaptor subunit [Tolumonas sp.]|nr:efflux RND transporter periplasmic adaptor subunit [Tolumonas sp.]